MPLSKEEEELINQRLEEARGVQTQNLGLQSRMQEQDMFMQNNEKSMISEQINVGELLDLLENLLRGNVLKEGDDNITRWMSPVDDEMIILTDYGVHLIMNTITFYINKNTLLSNYPVEIIDSKMEDFATDLADTVFMESEKIFKYPSFDDCKKILLDRIERKTNVRAFAYELIGKVPDKQSIKEGFVKEIEEKIEEEILKIKEQVIKNKLKRFLILLRTVQDAVHSTYLRAAFGQERKTLREHIHVSESRGMNMPQQRQPSKLNPLNWMGR